MAGAAAAMTGSAFVATSQQQEATTACADNTVVGMLQGISKKIANIEAVMGSVEAKAPPTKRAGIDVVLGAQWGDEGKGKLVDILSQVGEEECNVSDNFIVPGIDELALMLISFDLCTRNMMFAPE
jgi:hypothetical protein